MMKAATEMTLNDEAKIGIGRIAETNVYEINVQATPPTAEQQQESDIFELARSIYYRGAARRRFRRGTSII